MLPLCFFSGVLWPDAKLFGVKLDMLRFGLASSKFLKFVVVPEPTDISWARIGLSLDIALLLRDYYWLSLLLASLAGTLNLFSIAATSSETMLWKVRLGS